MDHEEARDLFSEHLDGELDASATAALVAHLETCADCREALARFRATVASLEHMAPPPPPRSSILSAVQSKIRKRSGGRYFRRGFAVGRTRIPYETIALLMLLLLLVIYLGMVSFQDLDAVSGGLEGRDRNAQDARDE